MIKCNLNTYSHCCRHIIMRLRAGENKASNDLNAIKDL